MNDTEENKGPIYIYIYIYIYMWQFVKLSATSSAYPPKRKETGINNQKMKRNSHLLKI